MGARSAQRGQAAAQQEAAQNAQLAELQAQQQAAAPAAPAELDEAAQIQKYAALKGQGLLTEEEFEAKKKQILGI
jgi:Short C-terminal domain